MGLGRADGLDVIWTDQQPTDEDSKDDFESSRNFNNGFFTRLDDSNGVAKIQDTL